MGRATTGTGALLIAGLIAAQVILPATLDLIVSLALVGGGFWLGRKSAS